MPKQQVPLTTLLSWAWIAHTIEVDNAFEAAGSERMGRLFRISLPMWTNGLRCIDDDGVTVEELRARSLAACNIGGLERWGWISVGETGGSRRDGYGRMLGVKAGTVLRPTRAGAHARRLWPQVVGEVEDRWCTRFGGDVTDALRNALSGVVTPMPWSPPEVNPTDGFRTHVHDGAAVRDGRPLVALLGQVLTASTLDYEQASDVSLPLGADVLRVVGSSVVRIKDLPRLAGLSKEGISMAIGYLRRADLAAPAPRSTVSLTPQGLDALDVPPRGCWRGDKPYLAQTERLLADPTGALPWHPLVLHRGAWPDGC